MDKARKSILCVLAALILVWTFSAGKMHGVAAQSSSTPAVVLAGIGTPMANSMPCNAGIAGSNFTSVYDQRDITTGNAIWKCKMLPDNSYSWVAPFNSPVLGVATTGTFAAQSYLLGNCTAVQTVTINGAVVGTNAATASPIFATAPNGSAALLNVTAWVSGANTVSVQGCAFGTLASVPAFTAKVFLY